MEAVFMARQALFRNSVWVVLLSMLTGCFSKTNRNDLHVVPKVWVADSAVKLHQHQGVLYYGDLAFSGYTYRVFENGDTAKLTPYYEGREEGWMKTWYSNKQLSELRFFKQGKKEGIHNGWWEDGSQKFEYHFADDEHEGELKEWYTNGKLARLFHYAKGYEEGSEKMWWENGDVRANYIVKDGDRFGLTGQKLCKNSLDEKP